MAPTATAHTEAELQAIIYQGMRQFTPTFHIQYKGMIANLDAALTDAMKRAIAKDDYIAGTIQRHGYSYEGYDRDVDITISLTYNTTAQQEQFVQQEVRRIVTNMTTRDMLDVEKVQAINEWLVLHTSYSKETNGNPHAAHTIFTEHKGVCQGYAMAAYAMLRQAGLRAHYVTGVILKNNEPHAWNLVQVDGEWYHLDVTWNDPRFQDDIRADDFISYEYFLQSEVAMRKTRTIHEKGEPRATSERFRVMRDIPSTLLRINGTLYSICPSYANGKLYAVKDDSVVCIDLTANVPRLETIARMYALGIVATATHIYVIDGKRGNRITEIDALTKRVKQLQTDAVTKLCIENSAVVGYANNRVVWKQATEQVQTATKVVDHKSGAVVRQAATKDSRTLAVLPQHTVVHIYDEQGDWVRVRVNGIDGYMLQNKLRTS